MNCAWLFNPENDITLALDVAGYTSSRNVAMLHRAGAELPLWIASAGDTVIARDRDREWEKTVCGEFGLEGSCASQLIGNVSRACPWGWSRNAVWQFERAGVPPEVLPDEFTLSALRDLSHRRTAGVVNRRLADLLDMPLPPAAVEARDRSEVVEAVKRFDGEAVIKSPWSSTGRGVIDTRTTQPATVLSVADAAIRRQGSVLVEKALDNRCDFAMLFEARRGRVAFVGYSLFETAGGAYTGNFMLPDDEIESRLAAMTGIEPLRKIKQALPLVLEDIIKGCYEGYFGVDMLVYSDDGVMLTAPCIEVNLRMTMGVYARLWRQSYLAEGSYAVMKIAFGETADEFQRPEIVGGRLVSGTQRLTPHGRGFTMSVTAQKS